MALTQPYTASQFALLLGEAYFKIQRISADFQKSDLDIWVYASEEARRTNANPLTTLRVSLDTPKEATELWPALYTALKALPEFADAEDC